jgi:RimJ/RimL family protein N-acetyltransferase
MNLFFDVGEHRGVDSIWRTLRMYTWSVPTLRFIELDPDIPEHVECLVRWGNDPEIRHLFQRFKNETDFNRVLNRETLEPMIRKSLGRGKHIQLISYQDQIVGEISVEMDMPALHEPKPNTAWLGIVIGEAWARGQGLGRRAMLHLEDFSRSLGAQHAQLGVFEFNEAAQGLYKKLDYQQLNVIPEFTWWKGKLWSDIRLGKSL